MKSVIENGGIQKQLKIVVTSESKKPLLSNSQVLALMILNNYLNAIDRASDTESLRKETSKVEFEVNLLKLQNPFYSGFTEDGFGVYLSSNNERVIFVECEVDPEIFE